MIARILLLKSCAVTLRMLGHILDNYQLIALILFIISTTGPHIRVGNPFYYTPSTPCVYLGSRGFIATDHIPDCPLFVMMDSKRWRHSS